MKSLMFFCSLVILISCDPTHDVDYIIRNSTKSNITIISKFVFDDIDTNSISNASRLVLYNDFKIGESTSEYIDNLKKLDSLMVFQNLIIFNPEGIKCKKDLYKRENWNISCDDSKGTVEMIIEDKDFE